VVKEWWVWCRMNRITPLYKWIPREENALADELSKIAATTIPGTDPAKNGADNPKVAGQDRRARHAPEPVDSDAGAMSSLR
jgi:hypothetical protein